MKCDHRNIVLGTMLSAALAFGGESLDLTWSTIDGGGGSSTGGALELNGTIGQPDAGIMSGGTLELDGGFWSASAAPASIPGDCDDDGDVDLNDYLCFEPCITGPGGTPLSGCDEFDLDADSDVDMTDFAEFARAFTGV